VKRMIAPSSRHLDIPRSPPAVHRHRSRSSPSPRRPSARHNQRGRCGQRCRGRCGQCRTKRSLSGYTHEQTRMKRRYSGVDVTPPLEPSRGMRAMGARDRRKEVSAPPAGHLGATSGSQERTALSIRVPRPGTCAGTARPGAKWHCAHLHGLVWTNSPECPTRERHRSTDHHSALVSRRSCRHRW
jgi:hypothetical protein